VARWASPLVDPLTLQPPPETLATRGWGQWLGDTAVALSYNRVGAAGLVPVLLMWLAGTWGLGHLMLYFTFAKASGSWPPHPSVASHACLSPFPSLTAALPLRPLYAERACVRAVLPDGGLLRGVPRERPLRPVGLRPPHLCPRRRRRRRRGGRGGRGRGRGRGQGRSRGPGLRLPRAALLGRPRRHLPLGARQPLASPAVRVGAAARGHPLRPVRAPPHRGRSRGGRGDGAAATRGLRRRRGRGTGGRRPPTCRRATATARGGGRQRRRRRQRRGRARARVHCRGGGALRVALRARPAESDRRPRDEPPGAGRVHSGG
jgi:hypothetical protein